MATTTDFLQQPRKLLLLLLFGCVDRSLLLCHLTWLFTNTLDHSIFQQDRSWFAHTHLMN